MIELINEPLTRGINWLLHDELIRVGILKLRAHDVYESSPNLETIYLLQQGRITLFHDISSTTLQQRESRFNAQPQSIHFSGNQSVIISATCQCEIFMAHIAHDQSFKTHFDLEKKEPAARLQMREQHLKETHCLEVNEQSIVYIHPQTTVQIKYVKNTDSKPRKRSFNIDHPCAVKLNAGDTLNIEPSMPVYMIVLTVTAR